MLFCSETEIGCFFVKSGFPEAPERGIRRFFRDEADFNGPGPWEAPRTPKMGSLTPEIKNIVNHWLGLEAVAPERHCPIETWENSNGQLQLDSSHEAEEGRDGQSWKSYPSQ